MGQIIVTEISVNQQCENTNRIHIYIYYLILKIYFLYYFLFTIIFNGSEI